MPKIKRWSLSAYKQWAACPAQYAYQRFDRLPTPAVPVLERGTKIHKLGEQFVNGEITGMPKELESFGLQFETIRDMGFVAEEKWAVNENWEPVAWDNWNQNWGMGVTDAHYYDETEHHLDIIDYKTGKIYGDHDQGAQVYSALGLSVYPELETVSVEFWYLDQGEGNIGDSPFEYDRTEVMKYRKIWTGKVRKMMKEKKFRPSPSYRCSFCPFRSDKKLANGEWGPCDAWQS